MGKVKVGLYVYLTADILTKVLQKCSLSSPLPNICTGILSKPLNLIGCHGNQKAKFTKIYKKKYFLRTHNGDEAETVEMFITLASTNSVFLLPLLWQLSFNRLIMGKVKVGLYFYLTADILTKVLQKCSLSKSSMKYMYFVQIDESDWLPWQPKG